MNTLKLTSLSVCAAMLSACAPVPADRFDMTHWQITLPNDQNGDDKPDTIGVKALQSFSHSDYFYLNADKRMVFVAPNKGLTTPNSTNARSELRYMLRGMDTAIAGGSPRNHFALQAHPAASEFAAIGGKMAATLHVDAVSQNATYADKPPAYSIVVGQIHGKKTKSKANGFGWGNEPLKIHYKKWPNHKTGSVFWNYERNLPKDDPNRIDIAYTVWGSDWDDDTDPGSEGIALGESFSYTVNVYGDTMYLTFESENRGTVRHQINLANNIDAEGRVDRFDHKQGYSGDMLYFKAGAYNQCSPKDAPSFRYPACPGTGNLATDMANGNYAQATFSRLIVGAATPPEKR